MLLLDVRQPAQVIWAALPGTAGSLVEVPTYNLNAPLQMQKLYCYVDETGQDTTSSIFVVVAVVSAEEQEQLREALMAIEHTAGTGQRKWHKSRPQRRREYLNLVVERGLGHGYTFFGSYLKPVPYFFPLLEVVEYAIKAKAVPPYTARVFVDGIDHKKATELTNALRLRGMSLEMVRSRRDESEPIIRLADMWAGCIRAALLGASEERGIFEHAIQRNHMRRTTEKSP
jgi:hypothetical protein